MPLANLVVPWNIKPNEVCLSLFSVVFLLEFGSKIEIASIVLIVELYSSLFHINRLHPHHRARKNRHYC